MLAARDLCFSFRAKPVLRGMSFAAAPGTRTAIVGANGSGKSTLLRLLGGHLKPSTGTATLAGAPIASIPPSRRARRIAIVPQSVALAFPFTVARFVAFGRHALNRSDVDAAARDALRRVDLADRAGDPLGELSLGQQQRASIARALCQLSGMPPGDRYLLADEPTASLDPAHTLIVRAIVDELAEQGIGVLASLHDLGAAAEFDRVILLGADGASVASGPPGKVLMPEPLRTAFGVGFNRHHDARGRLVAMTPIPAPPDGVDDVHFNQ